MVQGGHPGRRDLRAGRVLRPHDVGLVHVRRLGRIDWNSLATGRQGSNFTVNVGGHQLSPPNGPNGNPNGVWTGGAGLATNSALGRSNATLTWSCRNNPGPGPNSCGNGSVPIHSLYLGDEATAGIVDLVRTSGTGQSSGSQPGAPLHGFGR